MPLPLDSVQLAGGPLPYSQVCPAQWLTWFLHTVGVQNIMSLELDLLLE